MRTIIIATLAGVLAVGACKNKESMPSNDNKSTEWPPLSGRPLFGDLATRGPRLPLSTEDLVKLAYRFYPRINELDYEDPDDFVRDFQATPEFAALSTAQYQSWERIKQFSALVSAVRQALPPDSYAKDHTVPGHNAAYEAVFALPIRPESLIRRTLVLQISYLVPYYFLYESHSRRVDEGWKNLHVLHDTTPELGKIRAIVEHEISRVYGYQRLAPEIAETPVPGIYITGYYEGTPILGAALFGPRKW